MSAPLDADALREQLLRDFPAAIAYLSDDGSTEGAIQRLMSVVQVAAAVAEGRRQAEILRKTLQELESRGQQILSSLAGIEPVVPLQDAEEYLRLVARLKQVMEG